MCSCFPWEGGAKPVSFFFQNANWPSSSPGLPLRKFPLSTSLSLASWSTPGTSSYYVLWWEHVFSMSSSSVFFLSSCSVVSTFVPFSLSNVIRIFNLYVLISCGGFIFSRPSMWWKPVFPMSSSSMVGTLVPFILLECGLKKSFSVQFSFSLVTRMFLLLLSSVVEPFGRCVLLQSFLNISHRNWFHPPILDVKV